MSRRTTLDMTSEFLAAADALVEIVDGARADRWRKDHGGRLTDTPEWCAFYVLWCEIQRAVEAQEGKANA
jgi:hypothetical protein